MAGRENISRVFLGAGVSALFGILLGLSGFLYRLGGQVEQHKGALERIERDAADWYRKSDALRDGQKHERTVQDLYERIEELKRADGELRENLGGQNIAALMARVAHLEGRMAGRPALP